MTKIKWTLTRTRDGGWIGCIYLPFDSTAMPHLPIPVKARDHAVALTRAATVATKVQEALAQHPELQAILPPGTGLALSAIKGLSKSALAGKLSEALSKHSGPGIRRLGKVLGL